MQTVTTAEYLAHMGCAAPPEPTLDALRQLVTAHLDHVPFENIDILAQRPFSLEKQNLWTKIVRGNRGGVCHELNHAFLYLLQDLAFNVYLGSARIDTEDNEVEHSNLRVNIGGVLYLVDVGFCQFPIPPLHLDTQKVQTGFGRTYQIRPGAGDTLVLWIANPGEELRPFQVLYQQRRETAVFLPVFRDAAMPGATPFSSIYICTRYQPRRSWKMVKNKLIILGEYGAVTEQITIQTTAQRQALLTQHFGLPTLGKLPE